MIPLRRLARLWHFALVWLGAVLVAAPAVAADPPKTTFNLPEGDAAVTLRQFSQQTRAPIVYPIDVVRGVKTNPVQGEFTARAALDRMVAGTELIVAQDTSTGALSVGRPARPSEDPRRQHATGEPHSNSDRGPFPSTPPSSVKNNRRTFLAALGGWLTLGLSPAQLGRAADAAAANAQPTASVSGRVQNVVTGQYLNNARVTARGTGLVAFTDQSGSYRLPAVPPGGLVIEAFYTGLDSATVSVSLVAGQALVHDFELTNAVRYGAEGVVKLDAFTVATARDTNAESIAINEQRFAANLKNVVTADAFGDVTDGNVGEFLKFMPGITTDSDVNEGGTVTSVSVRGFAANMTQVSNDGALLSNTGSAAGNGRTFYFSQVSTNNLARVEVTKSPTPANPADTMAGSVNLVSKSAFERKDAQFNYSVNLSGSSQSLSLGKEPWINDRMVYKVLPGVSFDYTLPINRNLGIVVTGLHVDRYVDQTQNTLTYASVAAAGASLANPFLQAVRFVEGPRLTRRRSLGTKVDWRVTTNAVLSVGLTTSSFTNNRSAMDLTVNTGTNATPTVAGGRSLSFGPGFTSGATGRGVVGMLSTFDNEAPGRTRAGNLRYRFD
ncbi:MAG: TonB-dependent receptor plug domain-containing protein, partial [Opitutaceae bacterium]|nr:TonB-dependent receptor plug domain-containing protein [Opitutaceae bacterium]